MPRLCVRWARKSAEWSVRKPMNRARAKLGQSSLMDRDAVPAMLFEAVARILLSERGELPVPRDLGHNRGCGSRDAASVAFDERLLVDRHRRQHERIHQQRVRYDQE